MTTNQSEVHILPQTTSSSSASILAEAIQSHTRLPSSSLLSSKDEGSLNRKQRRALLYNEKQNKQKQDTFSKLLEEIIKCPICLEISSQMKSINCGHSVCFTCIEKIKSASSLPTCPICRAYIFNTHSNLIANELSDKFEFASFVYKEPKKPTPIPRLENLSFNESFIQNVLPFSPSEELTDFVTLSNAKINYMKLTLIKFVSNPTTFLNRKTLLEYFVNHLSLFSVDECNSNVVTFYVESQRIYWKHPFLTLDNHLFSPSKKYIGITTLKHNENLILFKKHYFELNFMYRDDMIKNGFKFD